ncbi:MAG: AAA family ATPase [Eubacteriales bacterium]|nr:AAA family ATPase [Eubacteriales bacterium]
MYCILITGIPAAGKSTLAKTLSEYFKIPVISKDSIKELMYDDIGFHSREEKVKLGIASMNIMYYFAEQLMKYNHAFILENNFEDVSKETLLSMLEKYSYKAITITLTGEYEKIYQRFLERNTSPDRHRGHVVNNSYPEREGSNKEKSISYADYVSGIKNRGMDRFVANGQHIVVDTTTFDYVDTEGLIKRIIECKEEILHG